MKKFHFKQFLALVVVLIVVGGVIFFVFFGNLSQYSQPLPGLSPLRGQGNTAGGAPRSLNTGEGVLITEADITFILERIGASALHNAPFSSSTPKIAFVVDESVFFAEVIKKEIITKKGSIDDPDIIIRTSGKEVLEAKNADDVKAYIKSSVAARKTHIEQIASQTTLFLKGYLSLYDTFK